MTRLTTGVIQRFTCVEILGAIHGAARTMDDAADRRCLYGNRKGVEPGAWMIGSRGVLGVLSCPQCCCNRTIIKIVQFPSDRNSSSKSRYPNPGLK